MQKKWFFVGHKMKPKICHINFKEPQDLEKLNTIMIYQEKLRPILVQTLESNLNLQQKSLEAHKIEDQVLDNDHLEVSIFFDQDLKAILIDKNKFLIKIKVMLYFFRVC